MKKVKNILHNIFIFTMMVLGILYLDTNSRVQSEFLLDFQDFGLTHSMKERPAQLSSSSSFDFLCDQDQDQDEKKKLNNCNITAYNSTFKNLTFVFSNNLFCSFISCYPLFYSDTSPPSLV